MPTPALEVAHPLRVAECRRCGQLFAVGATAGDVACPACDAPSAVSALEVVELQLAQPVEKPLEKLPEGKLANIDPPPIARLQPSGPPTVADWLLQQESAKPTPPTLERSDSKRSLAESLGWRGESVTPIANELPSDSPAERNPLADFRFDFGATPLSEAAPAPARPEGTLDLSSSHDEPAPPLFRPRLAAGTAQGRGWSSLLSSVAGLLMIVVPGAYLALNWQDAEPLDGSLVVEGSGAEARERRAVMTADEPAPFSPPPAFGGQPEAGVAAIVDPATKPASFSGGDNDEPKFDLPPSAPRVIAPPARDTVVTNETTAHAAGPDDPFATKPPQEPASLDLPGDQTAAFPARETPTSPSPLPTLAVGLRNAPTYGGQELAASLARAEESGAAFSSGSLADPERVAAMGQHYAQLCQLAQVLTLLEASPTDMALTTTELQGAEVFKRLFRGKHSRSDSQQVAAHWIAWTGRPHGGVFFCGVPVELSIAGQAVQYEFRLADTVVPVVMAKRLDADRFANSYAHEVGVIGVVVENPREWIAGYEGEAERVVWARKTIPLPEPDLP